MAAYLPEDLSAEDIPLAGCSECGMIGTEDEVKYTWDGDEYGYDNPICWDCHCEAVKHSPKRLWV